MASGGKKEKEDEGSAGSWFTFGAALAAAAVGTYAAVKLVQHVTKEDEPPVTRGYSSGSVGGYRGGQDYQSSSSSDWFPSEDSYNPYRGSQEPKRVPQPFGSIPEGGNNYGPVERNPSTHGGGLVLEEEKPWCLTQGELETWYNENIQLGTEEFKCACSLAIDNVVRHIHRKCSSNILNFDVDKVVKGGSLGKGTMVKDLSDVDLVAFVNRPHLNPIAQIGKEVYKETLSTIISDIKSTLRGVPNVQIIRSDQYLVNFKIQVGSRWIEVDLLPTTENVKYFQSSYRNMFMSMLDVGHGTRGFYSAALVQHQKRFVGERPGYLKALIRLVKFWASKYLPAKLKKSYPLELITIYLWEKAGKPERRLSKAKGLRSILEVLTNLDSLHVYWNYMSGVDDQLNETIIKKLDMKRPIILDPANPTNNVGILYQWGNNKEVIKAAAEKTLRTTLLSDVTAW